jgi:Yip1 domain
MDEQIPKEEEWQAPPLPEEIKQIENPPQMSEAATLGSIFFEPGKTFEDMRRKPRFVMAGIIIIVLVSLFQILFIQKIGYERIVKESIEANPMTEQMSKEQKDQIIEQQSSPVAKAIGYVIVPIGFIILFLLGGLLYWLGANAMGGSARFLHGVSVWVYSSLPPTVVSTLANFLVLFLKAPDDIDIMRSQGGLIQANPSFFIDAKAQPVLSALLASIDLFAIWGWILAAIGLQIVAKISSGAAWGIVLILALVWVTARVVKALFFG